MHMRGILHCLTLALLVAYCTAFEGNIRNSATYAHEIPTKHWAVQLSAGADPDVVARAHGFMNLGPVGTLEGVYLFQKGEDRVRRSVDGGEVEEYPHISTSPHVSWFENQVAKRRFKRIDTRILDPLFQDQWHLINPNGVDINVKAAWDQGFSGSGVTIGVVDDGLQSTHPDISNFKAEGSYDFNEGDADPTPHSGDDHGTSAGGVAGASSNSVCGVGAAFNAGLSGIRLIADFTTDAQEASGLSYRTDVNQIYTNSWGPNDDGRRLEGPGALTLRAMENAVNKGRSGKGSVYVWAGGNGGASLDNCNYDGYANSRFTITIGAVDYTGKQTYYSEPCAALLACAPSSGNSLSITTTDLLGNDGTSYNDCTSSFGGTSAAAPLVAGVVALILEVNHGLNWRDVQQIFVNTSKIVDEHDGDWVYNGGGYHHNHKYGFGLVDAGAAVKLAGNYRKLPAYLNVASEVFPIPKRVSGTAKASININDNIIVETVEVYISLTVATRGDFAISLTSPFGTTSQLQTIHNDRNANIKWMYTTVRSWGEHSKGNWALTVVDRSGTSSSSNSFDSWQIKIYGH